MKSIKQIITRHKHVSWLLKDVTKQLCRIVSMLLRGVFGFNKKAVVFQCWQGFSYADSPRAISEALHGIDPTFTIYWIFVDPEQKKELIPPYVKPIKANSFQALKVMATSKFWVDNTFKRPYVCKAEKQVYIQTWHGDRGFKKMFLDTGNELDQKIIEVKECDYITTGSTFAENTFRSAIRFEGEFLRYGLPRNDALIQQNSNSIRVIKDALRLKDSKIVLYAPTFRKGSATSTINLTEVHERLEQVTQESWVCLVRSHRQGAKLDETILTDSIVDVSAYEDMADLLQITDLLITDYSSSAGDFALTNKPIIIFQDDYLEYTSLDRKLYFEMKESGYCFVHTQKELLDLLPKLDEIALRNPQILSFYGTYETGVASEQIAHKIVEWANA